MTTPHQVSGALVREGTIRQLAKEIGLSPTTVSMVLNSILGGMRVTNGHILTVEAGTLRQNVEAQLSLFNSFRYRVVLASSHSGIWFAKGHHFDLESRKVSELMVTQLVRPPV